MPEGNVDISENGGGDNNVIGLVNADGGFSEGWQDRFSDNETVTSSKALENVKDFDDLVTQFASSQTLIGKKPEGLVVPGEDASDEGRRAFFTQLGCPESADGYEMGRPEGIPEDMYDTNMEQKFRGLFHERGVDKGTAEYLYGKYNEMQAANIAEIDRLDQKQLDDTTAELKKNWGGDYQGNFEVAKRAYERLGLEELAKVTGMGDDPRFIKLAFELSKQISEGDHIPSGGGGGGKPADGEVTFKYDK